MSKKLNEQKFCGWCGSKVKYVGEWRSICTLCKRNRYFNPLPCCNVFILSNDRVLMVKRNIEPRKGKYDFPGGFVDSTDESLEHACLREVREEIGVTKDQLGEFAYHGSSSTTYTHDDIDYRNLCFYVSTEAKTPDLNIKLDTAENEEFIWVEKKDFDNIDYAWDIDRIKLAELWGLNA